MKKTIISSCALGLVGTLIAPIVAGATNEPQTMYERNSTEEGKPNISAIDWEKEFPKLQNPKKDEIKPVNYSSETMMALAEITKKVDEAEKNYGENKPEVYMNIFKELFELHNKMPDDDRKIFTFGEQFSYIYYKTNYLVFTEYYENPEVFNKFYQDFSDMSYYYAVEIYNTVPDHTFLHFLFDGIYKLTSEKTTTSNELYFKDEKTNSIIQIAFSRVKYLCDGSRPNDPNTDEDDIKYDKPSDAYTPPTEKPIVPPDITPDMPDPNLPKPPELPDYSGGSGSDPNGGTYVEPDYENIDGECYHVEVVKDYFGNVVEKRKVKSENFFCGIPGGLDFGNIPWNDNNKMFNGEKSLDVWNSLAENDLNALSNFTLQFSLNKDSDNPYYYDSGIRVSKNKTVSYTQLRDVLNQIAIKSKGYLVEDEGKLLFIAEGKPLVVRDKKEEYTEEEVSNLLNSFKELDLKIRERGQGSINVDEELINNEDTQTITVNGEKVELSVKPRLENSILQLPVEEVGKALGYEVEIDDKVAKLTKDSTVIEIEIGTKNVKINGREKITATSSTMVDNVLFAEMNIVAQESGLKIYFDKAKGLIEIK